MQRGVLLSLLIAAILVLGCISPLNPGKGSLHVTSLPSRAEVYLDNEYRGTTPCTITNLEPGSHTIELRSQGYQDWSSRISVSRDVTNVEATLTPLSPSPVPSPVPQTPVPASPAIVVQPPVVSTPVPQTPVLPTLIPKSPDQKIQLTIESDKESYFLGEPVEFSGTCGGSDTVILKVYGPGKYLDGVELVKEPVLDNHKWGYTWNFGNAARPGLYTMYVYDPRNTVSERTGVIIRESVLTITANIHDFVRGNPVIFSGTCRGSDAVVVTLFGPGPYSNGVILGYPDVLADHSWSYTWTPGTSLDPGTYTMNVRDTQKTISVNVSVVAHNW
jgi:hypothetical protein